jgi:hypothetical protein
MRPAIRRFMRRLIHPKAATWRASFSFWTCLAPRNRCAPVAAGFQPAVSSGFQPGGRQDACHYPAVHGERTRKQPTLWHSRRPPLPPSARHHLPSEFGVLASPLAPAGPHSPRRRLTPLLPRDLVVAPGAAHPARGPGRSATARAASATPCAEFPRTNRGRRHRFGRLGLEGSSR